MTSTALDDTVLYADTLDGADFTLALLAARVPLTLLLDMAAPAGPPSHELYAVEGIPQQWLPGPDWPAPTSAGRE